MRLTLQVCDVCHGSPGITLKWPPMQIDQAWTVLVEDWMGAVNYSGGSSCTDLLLTMTPENC